MTVQAQGRAESYLYLYLHNTEKSPQRGRLALHIGEKVRTNKYIN